MYRRIFFKANASMDSLVEKDIIEDGQHYLDELQYDDYGKIVEQHQNVMKDDRNASRMFAVSMVLCFPGMTVFALLHRAGQIVYSVTPLLQVYQSWFRS
jgi:hypothetical protein